MLNGDGARYEPGEKVIIKEVVLLVLIVVGGLVVFKGAGFVLG